MIGTEGTEAKQRGADSQQNLATKLEDALRKSDVVAVWRLIADVEESEITTTAKDTTEARKEIKTLAALQVAKRVKRKEDEGLFTILRGL